VANTKSLGVPIKCYSLRESSVLSISIPRSFPCNVQLPIELLGLRGESSEANSHSEKAGISNRSPESMNHSQATWNPHDKQYNPQRPKLKVQRYTCFWFS